MQTSLVIGVMHLSDILYRFSLGLPNFLSHDQQIIPISSDRISWKDCAGKSGVLKCFRSMEGLIKIKDF